MKIKVVCDLAEKPGFSGHKDDWTVEVRVDGKTSIHRGFSDMAEAHAYARGCRAASLLQNGEDTTGTGPS